MSLEQHCLKNLTFWCETEETVKFTLTFGDTPHSRVWVISCQEMTLDQRGSASSKCRKCRTHCYRRTVKADSQSSCLSPCESWSLQLRNVLTAEMDASFFIQHVHTGIAASALKWQEGSQQGLTLSATVRIQMHGWESHAWIDSMNRLNSLCTGICLSVLE